MSIENKEQIKKEIAAVMNKHCVDNELNTPDFILADFLWSCLLSYGATKANTEDWMEKDNE